MERSPEEHEESRSRSCSICTMVSMYLILKTMNFICMVSNITSVVITSSSMLSFGSAIMIVIFMTCSLFGSRARYPFIVWFFEPGEIATLAVFL